MFIHLSLPASVEESSGEIMGGCPRLWSLKHLWILIERRISLRFLSRKSQLRTHAEMRRIGRLMSALNAEIMRSLGLAGLQSAWKVHGVS